MCGGIFHKLGRLFLYIITLLLPDPFLTSYFPPCFSLLFLRYPFLSFSFLSLTGVFLMKKSLVLLPQFFFIVGIKWAQGGKKLCQD